MRKRSRHAVLIAVGTGILAGIALMTMVTIWSNGRAASIVKLGLTREAMSVSQLVAFCRRCNTDAACKEDDQVAIGYCRGFVAGVFGSRADLRLCMPDDWDTGKALRLFQIWAEWHPEKQQNSAADEIMQAHTAAFDCRKAAHGI